MVAAQHLLKTIRVTFSHLYDTFVGHVSSNRGKVWNYETMSFPFLFLYNQIIPSTPILLPAAHSEDRRLMSHLIDTRDTDCFSSGGYEFHLHHKTTFPVEARLMLLHINLFLYTSETTVICATPHAHKSYNTTEPHRYFTGKWLITFKISRQKRTHRNAFY